MTKTTLSPPISSRWRWECNCEELSRGQKNSEVVTRVLALVVRNSSLYVAVCQPKPADYVNDLQHNGLFVSATPSTTPMLLLPNQDKTVDNLSQGALWRCVWLPYKAKNQHHIWFKWLIISAVRSKALQLNSSVHHVSVITSASVVWEKTFSSNS